MSEEQSLHEDIHAGEGTENHQATEAPTIDIWGLLQYCFVLMHSHAWQAMGLTPNPATGKIEKDLGQAKTAIDVAVYLVSQMDQHIPGQQLRDLRSRLSDLQLNFVNQQNTREDENPTA